MSGRIDPQLRELTLGAVHARRHSTVSTTSSTTARSPRSLSVSTHARGQSLLGRSPSPTSASPHSSPRGRRGLSMSAAMPRASLARKKRMVEKHKQQLKQKEEEEDDDDGDDDQSEHEQEEELSPVKTMSPTTEFRQAMPNITPLDLSGIDTSSKLEAPTQVPKLQHRHSITVASPRGSVRSPGGLSPRPRAKSMMGKRPVIPRPVSSRAKAQRACENCEEKAATVSCRECGQDFCDDCDAGFHSRGKKKSHVRSSVRNGRRVTSPIAMRPKPRRATSPISPGRKCENCEEAPGTIFCSACGQHFCQACDAGFHRRGKKATHKRVGVDGRPIQLTTPPPSPSPRPRARSVIVTSPRSAAGRPKGKPPLHLLCQVCEDQDAALYCPDCRMFVCRDGDCNLGLHRAKNKRSHVPVMIPVQRPNSGCKCGVCKTRVPEVYCLDCRQFQCKAGKCHARVHPISKKDHKAVPLPADWQEAASIKAGLPPPSRTRKRPSTVSVSGNASTLRAARRLSPSSASESPSVAASPRTPLSPHPYHGSPQQPPQVNNDAIERAVAQASNTMAASMQTFFEALSTRLAASSPAPAPSSQPDVKKMMGEIKKIVKQRNKADEAVVERMKGDVQSYLTKQQKAIQAKLDAALAKLERQTAQRDKQRKRPAPKRKNGGASDEADNSAVAAVGKMTTSLLSTFQQHAMQQDERYSTVVERLAASQSEVTELRRKAAELERHIKAMQEVNAGQLVKVDKRAAKRKKRRRKKRRELDSDEETETETETSDSDAERRRRRRRRKKKQEKEKEMRPQDAVAILSSPTLIRAAWREMREVREMEQERLRDAARAEAEARKRMLAESDDPPLKRRDIPVLADQVHMTLENHWSRLERHNENRARLIADRMEQQMDRVRRYAASTSLKVEELAEIVKEERVRPAEPQKATVEEVKEEEKRPIKRAAKKPKKKVKRKKKKAKKVKKEETVEKEEKLEEAGQEEEEREATKTEKPKRKKKRRKKSKRKKPKKLKTTLAVTPRFARPRSKPAVHQPKAPAQPKSKPAAKVSRRSRSAGMLRVPSRRTLAREVLEDGERATRRSPPDAWPQSRRVVPLPPLMPVTLSPRVAGRSESEDPFLSPREVSENVGRVRMLSRALGRERANLELRRDLRAADPSAGPSRRTHRVVHATVEAMDAEEQWRPRSAKKATRPRPRRDVAVALPLPHPPRDAYVSSDEFVSLIHQQQRRIGGSM